MAIVVDQQVINGEGVYLGARCGPTRRPGVGIIWHLGAETPDQVGVVARDRVVTCACVDRIRATAADNFIVCITVARTNLIALSVGIPVAHQLCAIFTFNDVVWCIIRFDLRITRRQHDVMKKAVSSVVAD